MDPTSTIARRSRASAAVQCPDCGKSISRKSDLPRHMKIHAPDKESLMHRCSYPGCTYKTLQKKNLDTHCNTHTHRRPHLCPEQGCDFSTGDPGSLTHHRTKNHEYVPKANSRTRQSTSALRVPRQHGRYSPYSASSRSSSSSATVVPTMDPASGPYHTPLPQHQDLELDEVPPVVPARKPAWSRVRSSSEAFSTHLITQDGEHPELGAPGTFNSSAVQSDNAEATPTYAAPTLPVPEPQHDVTSLTRNFGYAYDVDNVHVSTQSRYYYPQTVADASLSQFDAKNDSDDHYTSPTDAVLPAYSYPTGSSTSYESSDSVRYYRGNIV